MGIQIPAVKGRRGQSVRITWRLGSLTLTFVERRFYPRVAGTAEGYLALGDATVIKCRAVNISPSGGMLHLLNGGAKPLAIGELHLPDYGMIARCRIVWRAERAVGITFMVPPVEGVVGFGKRVQMPARPAWQSAFEGRVYGAGRTGRAKTGFEQGGVELHRSINSSSNKPVQVRKQLPCKG